jgi:hypothetical protein
MNTPQEDNPYVSPIVPAIVVAQADASQAEAIRRAHLGHEAEIRAVGWLYYFGATIVVLLWLLMALGIAPRELHGSMDRMFLGSVYFVLFVVHVVLGAGLRRLARWVRWPVGLLSCLGLLAVPAGTLINAYVLYLLFSAKGSVVLGKSYPNVLAETPHLKTGIEWVFWILFAVCLVFLLPMVSFVFLPVILESIRGR